MTSISATSLLAAVGTTLLVFGIAWRIVRRRRSGRLLAGLLRDPSVAVRHVAAGLVGQQGIGHHAGLLMERARSEDDPGVRRALAEAVWRNQWEPLDSTDMVGLRFWASTVLRSDEKAADVPRPLIRPLAEAGGGEITVLVTGGGGPAGVAVLQELRRLGVRTVSADCDPVSAGAHLADDAFLLPPAAAPAYVSRLVTEAFARGVHVIVPTVAEELLAIDDHRQDFATHGLGLWTPTRAAVEVCSDKLAFADLAERCGDPVAATCAGSQAGVWLRVPGPWIVKPRCGRGSRDVYTADTSVDLRWALGRVPDAVVQTRAAGREFTVDVLMGPGRLVGAVPRWRLQTRGGISTRGETFSSPSLIGAVERLLDHVGFVGPANVQGFLDGDTVTFIEVNPRFSGGLPLSLAAGADLVGECVRRALGVEGDAAALQYRSGVRMTRWFEQAFDTTPAEADLPAPLRIMAPQPSGEGEGARVRDVVA